MNDTLIFYEFSRSKVERGDFSHFLSLYSVDKLPTNRRLRDMMAAWSSVSKVGTTTRAKSTLSP
jgi:hypothetical protein